MFKNLWIVSERSLYWKETEERKPENWCLSYSKRGEGTFRLMVWDLERLFGDHRVRIKMDEVERHGLVKLGDIGQINHAWMRNTWKIHSVPFLLVWKIWKNGFHEYGARAEWREYVWYRNDPPRELVILWPNTHIHTRSNPVLLLDLCQTMPRNFDG